MKNIFITGATGFIGSELVKKLAGEGHQLKALYRSEAKAKALKFENVELIKGDLLATSALEKAIEGCDEVYHLAAYAATWAPNPNIFHQVNFEATRHILEIARKAGVKKSLITSTAGVIGPSHEKKLVDENTKRKVGFFGEYERTKWLSEQHILNWDGGDMKVVMVNPTRVYGPGLLSKANSVTRMIDSYLKGKFRVMPGSGKRIGNYAFVQDVVDGHILAMEKGRHKERYLLGGNNVSYIEFFDELSKVAGKKYSQFPIPPQFLTLAARFMLWRAEWFGKPPMITPDWARKFNNYDWAVSSRKAEAELDYRITPFAEALQQTVEWLRGN